MKILIVNTFFYPNEVGGAEKSCRVLANSLTKLGYNVAILSTTNKPSHVSKVDNIELYYIKLFNIFWHGENKKNGAIRGIIWHLLDSFNPFMFFKSYYSLKKIKPDVIHTNNIVGFSSSVWLAAKILKIPVVHTLRDFYLQCYRSCMRKNGKNCSNQCIQCKILTSPRKYLSSKVDAVVGNSQFMLNSHVKNGYFKNTDTKGVIFNAWSPVTNLEQQIQTRWKKNKYYCFGFIGRITEEKGIELLLESFLRIKNERQDLPLILKIAGDGSKNYIDYLVAKYGHIKEIIFLGQVAPEEFYNNIDYTVVPSLWEEPLARVVFESFFFGIPVLTTARGGNIEAIQHNINGFIFDETVDSLVEMMHKSINSNYRYLSENAFKSRNLFTIENLIEKYTSIYNKISTY